MSSGSIQSSPPDFSSVGPARPLRGEGKDPPAGGARRSELARLLLAIVLFLGTFVTTTTFGTGFYLSTRTDVVTDLVPAMLVGQLTAFLTLTAHTFRSVWSNGQLLEIGLAFSLPTLAILLAHELGHYFACRRNDLPSTFPYFIPAPLLIGTLGAFIRIRSPIRTRRELLEVGASGPIAGFLVLLPILIYGVAKSEPVSIVEIDWGLPGGLLLMKPGTSLLMWVVTRLFHGPLPTGTVLNLHPFALAAWVGTFVTALNLLPLGQLDGGHIFYAAFGRRQWSLSWWLLGLLALMGVLWPGWWVWCIVLLIIGPRHPPVLYGRQGLDSKQQVVALICLLILGLTFMPIPLDIVPILP